MVLSQSEVRQRITRAMSDPAPSASPFSLARALDHMSMPGGLREADSMEGQVCAEAARAAGGHHDPHRVVVPLRALLQRDLAASAGNLGGHLVETDNTEVRDMLRPFSVTLQAGVEVMPGLSGAVAVPRVTGDPAVTWLATESTGATEDNIALALSQMQPKSVSAYVEMSRRLLIQGTSSESMVQRVLLRAVGTALDRACVVGPGSSGQIQGLATMAGVGTAAGASLAWSGVLTARASAVQACGSDQSLAWVGGSVAQRILAGRERATGSGFIWDYSAATLDGAIAGHRAYGTSAAPTDALFLGDWSQMVVGIWGDAVSVEMNPYANFPAGIVGFRVILPCDMAVISPAYFSAITGIT